MLQVWEYQEYGVTYRGVMRGYSDHGGTDVTYRFHRLDNSGKPIRYDNGGIMLDVLNGSALKSAKRIGAMPQAEYETV